MNALSRHGSGLRLIQETAIRTTKYTEYTKKGLLLTLLGLLGITALSGAAQESPPLTLKQAHETALRNHPLISVADLKVLVSRQVVTQARSGFFPNLSANAVAVGTAGNNTRLEAIGALNNPAIF